VAPDNDGSPPEVVIEEGCLIWDPLGLQNPEEPTASPEVSADVIRNFIHSSGNEGTPASPPAQSRVRKKLQQRREALAQRTAQVANQEKVEPVDDSWIDELEDKESKKAKEGKKAKTKKKGGAAKNAAEGNATASACDNTTLVQATEQEQEQELTADREKQEEHVESEVNEELDFTQPLVAEGSALTNHTTVGGIKSQKPPQRSLSQAEKLERGKSQAKPVDEDAVASIPHFAEEVASKPALPQRAEKEAKAVKETPRALSEEVSDPNKKDDGFEHGRRNKKASAKRTLEAPHPPKGAPQPLNVTPQLVNQIYTQTGAALKISPK